MSDIVISGVGLTLGGNRILDAIDLTVERRGVAGLDRTQRSRQDLACSTASPGPLRSRARCGWEDGWSLPSRTASGPGSSPWCPRPR